MITKKYDTLFLFAQIKPHAVIYKAKKKNKALKKTLNSHPSTQKINKKTQDNAHEMLQTM